MLIILKHTRQTLNNISMTQHHSPRRLLAITTAESGAGAGDSAPGRSRWPDLWARRHCCWSSSRQARRALRPHLVRSGRGLADITLLILRAHMFLQLVGFHQALCHQRICRLQLPSQCSNCLFDINVSTVHRFCVELVWRVAPVDWRLVRVGPVCPEHVWQHHCQCPGLPPKGHARAAAAQ